jgi:hypothetical protein
MVRPSFFFKVPAMQPRTVWTLCRCRHKQHYADVLVMPTNISNSACVVEHAALRSA